MSSFRSKAVHPLTGEVEEADFLDDYFGRHRYGVRFADGEVFPSDRVKVPAQVIAADTPTNE